MDYTQINQIYDKLNNENYEKLEEAKSVLKKERPIETMETIIIIMSVVFVFLVIGSMASKNIWVILISSLTFICTIYMIFKMNKYTKGYKKEIDLNEYRKVLNMQVLNEIIGVFDRETKIDPNNGIPKSIYINAFFEKFKNYYSGNLIKSKIKNNYALNMSIVETSVYSSVDYNHNNEYDYRECTKFSGEFVCIEANVNKDLYIFLRNDSNDIDTYNSHSAEFPVKKLRVKSDFKEFGKLFDVYTNNEDIASQILTEETMRTLIEIYNKYNIKYEVTIKDSNIYIRVDKQIGHLGFLINFKYDKKQMYDTYNALGLIYELSNKLIEILVK